jgi:hypothetical protein
MTFHETSALLVKGSFFVLWKVSAFHVKVGIDFVIHEMRWDDLGSHHPITYVYTWMYGACRVHAWMWVYSYAWELPMQLLNVWNGLQFLICNATWTTARLLETKRCFQPFTVAAGYHVVVFSLVKYLLVLGIYRLVRFWKFIDETLGPCLIIGNSNSCRWIGERESNAPFVRVVLERERATLVLMVTFNFTWNILG